MKGLLRTVRSSFYDPAFYREIRSGELWPAMKLFSLLGAVGIALLMLTFVSAVVDFSRSGFPDVIAAQYPDDLVVQIEGGKLTLNQPQPYYIENTIPGLSGTGTPKYLAVFDASSTLPDDLAEVSTIVLVRDTYLVAPGQNDSQQLVPLSRVGTTTIDKALIIGFVDKVKPYFAGAVLGGGAALFLLLTTLGTLFWVLFHFIYILIPACLIYLFTRVRGTRLSYRGSYMTALYASVPVAIAYYIVFSLLLSLPAPAYTYTLLLLVVAIANLASEEPAPVQSL